MRYFLALCSLLLVSAGAFAVEGEQVEYLGGTAPGISSGSVGHFDTTSEQLLIFNAKGSRLEIPYASITSYEYSRALTHRLGLAPAVAVSMVRKRKRKHFYRIEYKGESGAAQAAVFEVSKGIPRVLSAVLQARVPNACKPDPVKKVSCGPGR